jgi:hydrophobic/amphiphilic exporter-1 (mainly G- bacteria), HAE1 family
MPLAKLAIKQPIFITMVLLAVTLVGCLSYIRMGVDLYPDMSNPFVSVSVPFAGAGPQDVETLVTKPIEKALSSVNGVDTISATSREGMSMVSVSFVVGYDLQQGAQDVRERLDVLKRSLPDGTDAPILRRFDPSQQPFMTVAMSLRGNNISPLETRRMVEDVVQPRLERLAGVASAGGSGYSIQEVDVQLIAGKLKALRVSPTQVVTALKAENSNTPSGRILGTSENVPVRAAAEFKNADELGNVIVARHGTRSVKLNEVATVQTQLPDKTSYTRVNGEDTLVLEVQKQSGSNVVQTAVLVREELKSLARDFPNLNFTIIRDDSTFIEQSDRDVTITLILGAILAALIVFLFFRNVRNTIITVAGLPIIVMAAFAVMSYLGFTRNIVSLMALSLSIGLLIDDAIVVRENIFRHMEHGESPKTAADTATGEIAFAVIAISLTIVAVFIPVAFTTGSIGRLFKQFGITVSVAVLISLFEAFTFAPLLSAYFAKPMKIVEKVAGQTTHGLGSRFAKMWDSTTLGYKRILKWSLNHRLAVVGAGLSIFLVTIWALTTLPVSFFPSTDPGQLSVGINLNPGTPLAKTDQVARDVEKAAHAMPEVSRVYARIGGGSSSNSGSMSITLVDGSNTDVVIKKLRDSLAQYGRNLSFSKPNQFLGVGGGMGGTNVRGRPVAIAVRGPVGLDALSEVSDSVIARLNTVPGLRDADKSLPPQEPEVHVQMDRQRTADAGISTSAVGQTIRMLVQGSTATQVDWNDQRMDVNVSLRDADLTDPSSLMDLPISGPNGDLYPLSAVATIERGTGPTVLERQDRQSQIIVGANLEGRTQGEVIPDVQKALADIPLPAGVVWQFTGMQSQTSTAFSSLIFALILGLIFVYMVLASQFGSFVHPFTVMAALPMAAVGSVLAMLVTRTELTVISMIGIILMMGLATKNSILLVDFIIRYRKQGQKRTEAVLEAGPVRLRPIMMTTLAIVIGMIPTAFGMGAAGSFRSPMAIAVIGGEFSSTILSLVVVPVIYTLLDDGLIAVARLFNRGPTVVEETDSNSVAALGRLPKMIATNGGQKLRHSRWWLLGH